MNWFLQSIMTHWYNFHEMISNLWADRTLKPLFWGHKMGTKYHFAVITAQKRSQTKENYT